MTDIDAALLAAAERRPNAESLNAISKRTGIRKETLIRHRDDCGAGEEDEAPDHERTASTDGADRPGLKAEPSNGPTSPRYAVRNPGDDPMTAPRKLIAADVEERCVALRVKGKSYATIAQEVGVSEDAAIDAVERVLLRKRRGADAKADLVRKVELERLDRLIEGLWDRATDPSMATVDVPADTESGVKAYDGQDKAVDRVLKAMERRAKLEGLDVPTGPSTVNFISHPVIQPVIVELMATQGRALEALLAAEGLGGDAVGRVLAGLHEASQALGADGEKGFERWLEERQRDAGALTVGAVEDEV